MRLIMSNTYKATGVTISRAFPPPEPLTEVLITGGTGEFTVNGPEDHQLVITGGNFNEGGGVGEPVTVRGVASLAPPAIGEFLINETMHTDSYDAATEQATFNGPILLAPVPAGYESPSSAATV
jgi:hypothetical protein